MPGQDADPVQERLDAISKALARLSRRLSDVEARLNAMAPPVAVPPPPPWPEPAEFQQTEPPGAPQEPETPSALEPELPGAQEQETPGAPPPVAEIPEPRAPVRPAAQPAPAAADLVESSFGLSWLNRIGVITLVLGVAFLFKYAIDNEWIGPWMRVAIGVMAGLTALVAAERLHRAGQRIFSMGITALGISILYVSCYAAYGFYQLAPVAASFAAMAAVTAAGAWLSLRYDAAAIAVLSLIGGFLTPMVLSTGRDAPWILFPYLLLLIAGSVWVRRARSWAVAEWLALMAGAAMYAAWFADHFETAKRAPAAFFPLCAYVLFSFSPSRAVRQLAHVGAGLSFALVFRPDAALLFAALLPLAAAGLLRNMTGAAALGFWLPYWIHASTPGAGEDFWTCVAGVSAGFVFIHGWQLWELQPEEGSRDWTVPMVYAANSVAWYASLHALMEPEHHAWTGAMTFLAAAVFAGSAWVAHRARVMALLSGVLAVAYFTLAIPIQFGAWRVSVAWILEAVVLAFLASRFQARLPHWIAAAVLLLGIGHTVVLDAQMETERIFANARFFVMAWAALGCWISAMLLRPRVLAAAAYMAGHAVMLGALELEVLEQIRRTAAPEDVRSASIVAFSLVLALYGFALVALGVARRARLDRVMGLIGLSLVIVKLYLFDVWQLGRLFRSTAFVGLGLLLVAASYLYSRHRERLAKWIR